MRYASLRQGLVGAWCPSISGPYGYSLPDLSGYANHGTLLNGTAWTTDVKPAMSFDGSDDYISTNASLNNLYAYSVSMWCKPFGVSGYRTEIAQGNNSGDRGGFSLAEEGNAYCAPSLNGYTRCNWSSLGVSNFIHLLCIFDANGATSSDRAKIYLNGKLQSTTVFGNVTTSPSNWSGKILIGVRTGLVGYSQGSMDDIRIYSRILSDSEIRLLASERGIGLKPERIRNRYIIPRKRSSRFLSFPS